MELNIYNINIYYVETQVGNISFSNIYYNR